MEQTNSGQKEALDFLGEREAYRPKPEAVGLIETHISVVFLAGDFAYKLKRAVKYPFLDFSTLEKREAACRNELRINRRTAPQIYLDVVPLTRSRTGKLRLGGEGPAVEWLLRMRRFPQDELLDRLAERGRIDEHMAASLAAVICNFHRSADRWLAQDHAVNPLASIIEDNEATFADAPHVFPADEVVALTAALRAGLAALTPLLKTRASGGHVRHCHGDLHLRNIVALDGKPVLFDAIEFDDKLATIDVLYDLAFLLMDLGRRGLGVEANVVLNAYLECVGNSGNLLGLAALPFFLAMRAAVRAKVECLRAGKLAGPTREQADAEAKAYFELARRLLAPPPQLLVAIGGLAGSGKSSVACALAPALGAFPGAVHVRTDVERKRLFGAAPTERLPREAYAPEVSPLVYAMCRKRAALALRAGHSVILDAVHARPEERADLAALAEKAGVAFKGLWLEAPADVMRQRVSARSGDVSDATPAVLDEQLGYDIGPQDFDAIDAGGSLAETVAAARARIDPRFMLS
jgi:aminoglycoside phosphotransferase family enzyme/predicted kinase